jgi:hypothetical protein
MRFEALGVEALFSVMAIAGAGLMNWRGAWVAACSPRALQSLRLGRTFEYIVTLMRRRRSRSAF